MLCAESYVSRIPWHDCTPQVLLLNKNRMRELPSLLACKKLEKLSAAKNQIESLVTDALPSSLQCLELGTNQVTDVPPAFFSQLP